ncbi:MAG: glycosyltransferase family 2 protein [Poseidonia sp.]|jgi:dolichol-phosphate mannosyltransferase
MQRLVVLLPVLNEALGLQWVLERIPHEALKAKGYETTVLVMDGHSTDRTEEVASSFGVLFIDQDDDGKGSAIRHGFRMAVELEADAVVMLDADGTYNPSEMLALLVGLNDENVVIGDRLNGDLAPDAMTRTNYVGNRLLTWMASAIYGSISLDVCSGYWAFSRGAIERLRLNSVSFEIEAEMFASMVHQRVPFRYRPISYRARLGEAKLGSTADGWKIFRKLITRRVFPSPLM